MHEIEFGNRLRFLRTLERLTQADLAERLEITVEHLGNIERGVSSPSFSLIGKIARALNTEPANLFLFSPESDDAPDSREDQPHPPAEKTEGPGGSAPNWTMYISAMGGWRHEVATGESYWSPGFFSILGYRPGEIEPDREEFRRRVHPSDRPALDRVRAHLEGGVVPGPVQYRIRWRDGTVRHTIATYDLEKDGDGSVRTLYGFLVDISEQRRLEASLRKLRNLMESRIRERTEVLNRTVARLNREKAEREQAREALRRSEERYRALYSKTPAMVFALDGAGRMQDASLTWLESMGYDMEEVAGREVVDLLTAVSRKRFEFIFARFLAEEHVRDEGLQFVCKNGEVMDVLFSAVAEKRKDGTLERALAVNVDVTSLHRAERTARVYEDRLHLFVRNLDDMVYFQSLDGRREIYNDANTRITGYAREEFERDPQLWRKITHPDDIRAVEEFFGDNPDGIPYFEISYRLRNRDGQWRWIDSRMFGHEMEDGEIAGYFCIDRDVTEVRSTQAALCESEQQLRLALEAADLSLWVLDPESGRVETDGRLLSALGHSPENHPQTLQNWRELVHPEDMDRNRQSLQDHIGGLTPVHEMTLRIRHGEGVWRWVHVRGAAIERTSDGRPKRVVGVFQDVHGQVEAKRLLEQSEAREKAHAEELRAVFEAVPAGILLCRDLDCTNVHGNRAAMNFLAMGGCRGKKDSTAMTPKALTEILDVERIRREDASGMRREVALALPDGGTYLDVTCVPLLDEKLEVRGAVAAMFDVTERKADMERIRQSEQRLRQALALARMGVWEFDPRTGRGTWSDELYELLGFEPGEFDFDMDRLTQLLHPDDREQVAEGIREALESFSCYHFEYRLQCKSGRYIHVHSVAELERDAKGRAVIMRGLLQDISARKADEAELRTIQRRLERAQRMAKLGSWLSKSSTGEMWWSPELYRIFGYEPAAIRPGFGVMQEHILPEDRDEVLAALAKTFEHGVDLEVEFRISRCDGSFGWAHAVARVVRDNSGEPAGLDGILQDVTERKLAEEEVRAGQERFRSLADNLPGYVARFDHNLRHVWVNRAVQEALGVDQERVHGKTVGELGYEEEDSRIYSRNIARVFRTGKPVQREFRRLVGDSLRWFELRIIPEFQGGEVATVLCVTHDVTRLRNAEQTAVAAMEEARRANSAKSEFLAGMSHEIRTPLNGIFAVLQILEMMNPSPEQQEYLELALASGRSLLAVIGDIIDLGRIEAGKLDINPEPFPIFDLVESVTGMFRPQAVQKGIDLHCELPADEIGHVIGDSCRLRQVLTNLVGNALKFTREGEVVVRLRTRGMDPTTAHIVLEVQDTGAGIEENDLERIFDLYRRGGDETTRQISGSGLGLNIVRSLVEIMGGEICVSSEVGSGSLFSVRLSMPRCKPPQEAVRAKTARPSAQQPLRILVVEDERISRLSLCKLLENMGHELRDAANGREALKAIRIKPPDLIFMDVEMPVMDGLETIRRLRNGEAGKDQARLPVVALTGCVVKGDRERILQEGADAYLAKPVMVDSICEMIRKMGELLQGRNRN